MAAALFVLATAALHAQSLESRFEPVTDAMIQHPDPKDWLSWRRTLNSWGYSPLAEIDRGNVRAAQAGLGAPARGRAPGRHAAGP